jgi:hypothetical protein
MSLMKVDERERHDGSVDSSTEGETRAEKTHSEVANPTVYDILALSGLVLLDILLQHTTGGRSGRYRRCMSRRQMLCQQNLQTHEAEWEGGEKTHLGQTCQANGQCKILELHRSYT